jgi:predicted acylesterase/phospholipase RssA
LAKLALPFCARHFECFAMHDVRTRLTDHASSPPQSRGWRPERCDRIALVLQGGGALGAYQAGVYQAMSEAGVEPDWVSGVSIGAINSAIIAGNTPKNRLRQLHTFWDMITERRSGRSRRMATFSAKHATHIAALSPASPDSRAFSSRVFPIPG